MLNGKIALVTGSSRGIGAEIARLFAEQGASVAVHGRDRAAVERTCGAIERTGGRAIAVYGDVTRWADIETMRESIESKLGPVDILVANAGASLTMPGPMEDITEDSWRATVEANLTATFLTLKSFVPGMKTRRSGAERNAERIPAAQQRELAATHPIPRLGTPSDVAAAALYLVSPASAWVTGIVLDVTGGAVMR